MDAAENAIKLLTEGEPYMHHTEAAVRGLAWAIIGLTEALTKEEKVEQG